MWQLARLLLTRHIARSLGDSWASCCLLNASLICTFSFFALREFVVMQNKIRMATVLEIQAAHVHFWLFFTCDYYYAGIMAVMSLLMRWSCYVSKEHWSAFGLIRSSGALMSSHILAAQLILPPTLRCSALMIVSWVWICQTEDSEFTFFCLMLCCTVVLCF